jgi:hypothetical protein
MTEQLAEPVLHHAHGDRLAVGAVEHVERHYLGAFDRSHGAQCAAISPGYSTYLPHRLCGRPKYRL